ncbi:MAG: hypothetical protein KatS3mg131_2462 [Candidatus Tectimicrobiota bacterium]|nr:MAG: hypothetical protein KatS3mg131_2462 [Candidatus Tectomicrobia bacterium]
MHQRYGARIQLEHRAFPLRPQPDASVKFQGTYREAAWQRAAALAAADGIRWRMWTRDDFPQWSLPALEAAKCAALQGEAAFADMNLRLFRGFFEQGVNIAEPEEILTLAREAPLDYPRFVDDFLSGGMRQEVLRDYEEALTRYAVHAIPTVVFAEREWVVGAVPLAKYEEVLAKFGVT